MQTDKSAVCKAEPVRPYSQSDRAKLVIALPSCDSDWVLHKIKNGFNEWFSVFI